MGLPSTFTQEMADLICERVATHDCGLLRLCKMFPDLPEKTTINLWRHRFPQFAIQYARAKQEQAELLAEQMLDISDDAGNDYSVDENGKKVFDNEHSARTRMRLDTRKWLAAKLVPRLYGDMGRITLEDGTAESVSNVRATVDAILKEKERPY